MRASQHTQKYAVTRSRQIPTPAATDFRIQLAPPESTTMAQERQALNGD